MTNEGMALAIHKQNFGHSASIVERADKTLLLVAGRQFCNSSDRGITWTKPYGCTDSNGDAVSGICAVRLAGNGIGVAGMRKAKGYASFEIIFWRSEDGGVTWEPPVLCTPPGFPAHMLQDVFLRTASGRLILPVYFVVGQGSWRAEDAPFPGSLYKGHYVTNDSHYFDPHFGACYVCYSDDEGRTWKKNADGELHVGIAYGSVFGATYEPTVAEVSPGKLLMLLRTGLGRMFQAWSDDNGETWSRPQPSSLASDHSPAQIRTIPSTGNLFVVWNQLSLDELRRGLNRTRISCAVSRNGGGVWEFFQNVQSILEETRVPAGPVGPLRPGELYSLVGQPATQVENCSVEPLPEGYGTWSYPSATVLDDRVLISHPYSIYTDHAERISPGGNSRLKVLPLEWIYGGYIPSAETPILDKVSTPPIP